MKPTYEGELKIKRWLAAQENLKSKKSLLLSAECDLNNAINDLGTWMVPEDIEIYEKICLWYGDSLIQVEKTKQNDYNIKIRKRGRKLI